MTLGTLGRRCQRCAYPSAMGEALFCPACGGEMEPARFAGIGRVWASTIVRVPVGRVEPPFGLAYVDLNDGPRALVGFDPSLVQPHVGLVVRVGSGRDGPRILGALVTAESP